MFLPTLHSNNMMGQGKRLLAQAMIDINANNAVESSGSVVAMPNSRNAGDNFAMCLGASGDYFSTPDSAVVSVTGDIDIRCDVVVDDWTNGVQTFVGKYLTTGNQRSYILRLQADGTLLFTFSNDGTGNVGSADNLQSSVAVPFANGQRGWVRVAYNASTGVATFYTSTDGVNWTQLGDTDSTANTATIFDGTANLEIGSWGGGVNDELSGRVYRVQMYTGETLVADFNLTDYVPGDTLSTDVAAYNSDFSAGVDGFIGVGGTAAGDIDSIAENDDWLRLTLDSANSEHYLERVMFTTGLTYTVTVEYYIPSSNSNLDAVGFWSNSNPGGIFNTVGQVATATFKITAGSTTLRVYAYDGSAVVFQDAAGDDVLYIRNISVTEEQDWTINGNNYIVEPRVPQGTNQFDAPQGLVVPYAFGNKATTPDTASISVTGDIDIRVRVKMDDWVFSSAQTFMGKDDNSSNREWYFRVSNSGTLGLQFWDSGGTSRLINSSTAVTFQDGQTAWVRVTLDVDDGGGGHAANFYVSVDDTNDPDAVNWTQLGAADQTFGAGTTSIRDQAAPLTVGEVANAAPNGATIYRGVVYDGIDGTLVADFNAAQYRLEGRRNLVDYSEKFDESYWTKTRCSITSNDVIGPFGVGADKLVEDSSTNTHLLAAVTTSAVAGTLTASVCVKAAERTQAQIRIYNATDGFISTLIVDLDAGSVVSGSGTIESLENDWYRISVTGVATISGSQVYIYPVLSGSYNYTGDGSSGIYVTGVQFELASSATDYQATFADFYSEIVNYDILTSDEPQIWTLAGDTYIRERNPLQLYANAPGTATNYFSTPSSPANQTASDFQFEVCLSVPDVIDATNQNMIGIWDSLNDRTWLFHIATTGELDIDIFDGASTTAYTSTEIPPWKDGQKMWVRFTWDADNGSNSVGTWYISFDGVDWVQLGGAIEQTTHVMNTGSATPLDIGRVASGPQYHPCSIYSFKFYKGFGDDAVLTVDFNPADYVRSSTWVSSLTGETWTINGSAEVQSFNLNTVVGTGANLKKHDSGAMLTYGASGDYASTPDNEAASVTGDIDIRVHIKADDWTPSADQFLVNRFTSGADDGSFRFALATAGTLYYQYTSSGLDASFTTIFSTVATGFVDGTDHWLRVTQDVNNGASGNTVTFYTSEDGVVWEQLGAPVVTGSTTSLHDSSLNLVVGSGDSTNGTTNNFKGEVFRAQVYDGIDGTLVADFKPTNYVSGDTFDSDYLQTYASDFSANIDGFLTSGVNISANQTIAGEDAWLRITMNFGTAYRIAQRVINDMGAGEVFRVKFKYYLPSTNPDVDGFRFRPNGGYLPEFPIETTTDEIVEVDTYSTAADALIQFIGFKGELDYATYTGTNYLYIKDIEVSVVSEWTLGGNSFIQNTGHAVVQTINAAGLETSTPTDIDAPGVVFVVGRESSDTTGDANFFDSRSDSTKAWELRWDGNAGTDTFDMAQNEGSANVDTASADNDLHLFTVQFNSSMPENKLTVSGIGSATGSNNGTDVYDFGTLFNNRINTSSLHGNIGRFVLFDRSLNEGEIAAVQQELLTQYGLTQ